ncbi:MAG: TonB-dependent receptor [Pseudomonadota bacterium]
MKEFDPLWRKTTLALAVSAALQANAQEGAAAPAPASATEDAELEEVVVVGEFQQSLVNRIPIAPSELPFTLNIVDREFLDARNLTRPIEALTTLPNITRTEDRLGTGTANFLSRGFEAPILVDNRVQNNFRGSGARDDAFVERYEVLKGPASISFGPIGAGGVINTVTKSPEQERFYDMELRADHFGSVGVEFDANFGQTFSESLMVRVSGAYRDFEFDANETERETLAIRPVVIVNLGEATSAKASVSYTESTVNPNFGFPLLSTGEIPAQIDTDTFTSFANGEGVARDVYYDAEFTHAFLDRVKLTLRGSRQETDFDYSNTLGLYNYNYADGGPGIGLDDPYVYSYTGGGITDSDATFADAQLAYRAQLWGQSQDFVIGFAYDERSFQRFFSGFPGVGPFRLDELDVPRFGPDDIGPLSPFTLFDQELHSVFAEAAIRPNGYLTFIGGVRYDDLDQMTVNFRRGAAIESPFDDSEITARLGATAGVTDNLNLYASFAQAFEPQFGVRRDSGTVGPELSNGFEVGAKGALFDRRFTFDAGLFYTLREDVAVTDPNNDVGEFFVVTVGELRVQGMEFTGNVSLARGLSLNLNFGYTDIDITEPGADEVQAAVFPEVTGSAYLRYEVPTGALAGLAFGGGLRYVGEREGPVVDFESYTVTDVNLSYAIGENLILAFDVLNVTDERYLENTASFAQNLTAGSVLGPPRTAVLTLRSSF